MKVLLKSRLVQNVGALSVLQAANYLAPLLTIPYLTRILGAQTYGLAVFVQVLMAWLVIGVNYGFLWSATQDISANRHDISHVSRLFAANWTVQWLLTFFAGAGLAAVVLTVPQLREDATVYLAGISFVLSTTLFPIWLMQGLERLREVAAFQLVGRAVLIVAVFSLVRGPEDVALAVLAQGSAGGVAGFLLLYWLRRKDIVQFRLPTAGDVFSAFRSGGAVFVSQIAISFYTTLVPTALGLVSGANMVGQYMVADRARVAAQSMIAPISQALFPRMSFLFATGDHAAASKLLRYSMLATLLISGSGGLAIFVLADWIVLILGGPDFAPAASVLRWLSGVPICVGLSNLFGVQIMLPRGEIRAFNGILISAAVVGGALILPMSILLGAEGAAITMLTVEGGVTVAMAVYLAKTGLVVRK